MIWFVITGFCVAFVGACTWGAQPYTATAPRKRSRAERMIFALISVGIWAAILHWLFPEWGIATLTLATAGVSWLVVDWPRKNLAPQPKV